MGLADFPKHLAPRFARIAIFLKFRKRRVKRLLLGTCGCLAIEQVGFVDFCESGKEL